MWNKHAIRPDHYDLLVAKPLFKNWTDAKLKVNLVPLIIWFLLRVILVTFYFLSVAVKSGTSEVVCEYFNRFKLSETAHLLVSLVAWIIAACMCIFDITEVLVWRVSPKHQARSKVFGRKKTMLVNVVTYWIAHFLLCLSILFCLPLSTLTDNDFSNVAVQILHIVIPILAAWSLLSFAQLLPSVGHALISIQRMFVDILHFSLIFLAVLLPFVISITFQILETSKEGCVRDYSDFYIATYTTYKLMLNMYDFSEVKVSRPGILYGLHVVYVTTIVVLLLNFLIAQMNNTATNISKSKENVIFILNRMSRALAVEERFIFMFRKIFLSWKRSHFETDDNGHIFLTIQKNILQDAFHHMD